MDKLTQFMCESWSLFAAAVLFTLVRLFARVRLLGFKGLQGDDYLALIALVSSPGLYFPLYSTWKVCRLTS